MTASHWLQLSAALIATLTPWLVVVVVHAVAAAHARRVAVDIPWPASARWLSALTPIAARGHFS